MQLPHELPKRVTNHLHSSRSLQQHRTTEHRQTRHLPGNTLSAEQKHHPTTCLTYTTNDSINDYLQANNCVRIKHVVSNSELAKRPVDYLAIGHVTRDVSPYGYQAGGTVLYSGRLATALGMRVGVVTSAAPDFDFVQTLPDMAVVNVPAVQSTTFENIHTSSGRRQIIQSLAEPLTSTDFPQAWRRTAIIHLAPLAGEIDPTTVTACQGEFVGLTAQGLMRCWGTDGRVQPCALRDAAAILPHVDAVIVSQDDLVDDAELARIRNLTALVVLTQGTEGCTVYQNGAATHITAPSVTEVNSVGAGDIFAAAFFIRMVENGRQAVASAEYATQIAALSVTQPTPDSKIQAISHFITRKALQTSNP